MNNTHKATNPEWLPETVAFINDFRAGKFGKETIPNTAEPYSPAQEESDNEAFDDFMETETFKSLMGL